MYPELWHPYGWFSLELPRKIFRQAKHHSGSFAIQRARSVHTPTKSEFQSLEEVGALLLWFSVSALLVTALLVFATAVCFRVLFTFNNQYFITPTLFG